MTFVLICFRDLVVGKGKNFECYFLHSEILLHSLVLTVLEGSLFKATLSTVTMTFFFSNLTAASFFCQSDSSG